MASRTSADDDAGAVDHHAAGRRSASSSIVSGPLTDAHPVVPGGGVGSMPASATMDRIRAAPASSQQGEATATKAIWPDHPRPAHPAGPAACQGDAVDGILYDDHQRLDQGCQVVGHDVGGVARPGQQDHPPVPRPGPTATPSTT